MKNIFKQLVLFVIIVLFIGGCYQKDISANNCLTKQEDTSNISKETAILIGKGLALFDYDLRNYEVSVDDENEVWVVKFVLKTDKTNMIWHGPTIWINKKNGEIVKEAFPK